MTRIQRLAQNLPKDADCAVITDGVNRRYFTGMKSSAGTLIVFRDKAFLLVDYFQKMFCVGVLRSDKSDYHMVSPNLFVYYLLIYRKTYVEIPFL